MNLYGFLKKMIFTCASKETVAALVERITLQSDDIKVVLDVHSELIAIQLLCQVELRFDDSLEYSCNATLVSMTNDAFIASSGGLLFLWTGKPQISDTYQFKYSVGNLKVRKSPAATVQTRRSKRTKAQ